MSSVDGMLCHAVLLCHASCQAIYAMHALQSCVNNTVCRLQHRGWSLRIAPTTTCQARALKVQASQTTQPQHPQPLGLSQLRSPLSRPQVLPPKLWLNTCHKMQDQTQSLNCCLCLRVKHRRSASNLSLSHSMMLQPSFRLKSQLRLSLYCSPPR